MPTKRKMNGVCLSRPSNINQAWSCLIIEELHRLGAGHFFLAPGSRSAPLAYAVDGNQSISSTVHFDERSLGFMACGYSSGTQKPAVVIVTSGTAVANLLPSIIEASKKKLPMIIITADRPPELQKTGAPQTIDQNNIFGPYVRWEINLPCPSLEISPAYVLTTIDQAMVMAKGELPGPVHLNLMFREPLALSGQDHLKVSQYLMRLGKWLVGSSPFTILFSRNVGQDNSDISRLAGIVNGIRRGVIAVGKLSTESDRAAVLRLSEKTGFPILPDVTSGLRLGVNHPSVISYFDRILSDKQTGLRIDAVIQFGGRMTSKAYDDFIKNTRLNSYVMILSHPLRNDPWHKVTHRVIATPSALIDLLIPLLNQYKGRPLLNLLARENRRIIKYLNNIFLDPSLSEPAVARIISLLIRPGEGLFLSNSLSVRMMDSFASNEGAAVPVGSNRGASGIDGIISSAVGYALGLGRPVTLVIGDLAFLHDLGALSLVAGAAQRIVVVVINNHGGGIFSTLPYREESDRFNKYFKAAHPWKFADAAKMFGINYFHPKSVDEFKSHYLHATGLMTSSIIEVAITDG